MTNVKFPTDFLWGVSSSAFQIEGASTEDGKGLSTVDTRKVKEGIADTAIASDHYHHWKEDISLLAEMGVKTYRFSISWTRIFPSGEGEVNQKGLQFYDNLIDELLAYNIEPLVTMYHFDLPQNLVDKYQGWLSRKTIDCYEKYAEVLFTHYGDRVKNWISINEELMVMYSQDFNGIRNLDEKQYKKAVFQMMYHMSLAEKKAFKLCHELVTDGKIGPANAFQNIYPATSDPLDVEAAMNAEEFLSYMLLDLSVKGKFPENTLRYLQKENLAPETLPEDEEILKNNKPDYICFNYYASLCAEFYTGLADDHMPPFFRSNRYRIVPNQTKSLSEWMVFGIDPVGMRISMRKLYNRYELPLMITENGYADSEELSDTFEINDEKRIGYLQLHLLECSKAIDEGIPLLGYSAWSFLDSLSGREGFSKRYGLVYVNRTDDDTKDLKRYKKKSFYWYQNAIKQNEFIVDEGKKNYDNK